MNSNSDTPAASARARRSRLGRSMDHGSVLFFASASVLLLCVAARTNAWTYRYVKCNGSWVKWRGDVDIHRNSFSISNSGHMNTAYWNGIHQWNKYTGLFQESGDFKVNPVSDTKWDKATNAENEISRVPRSAIDGVDGQVFDDIGLCGVGANDIDEMDVVIADDLTFPPQWGDNISSTGGNYGRTAFVHEMGHFFGMGHSTWAFAQMFSEDSLDVGGMGPITGGDEPAATFPDDLMGINQVYGAGASGAANLIASATRVSNNVIQTLNVAQTVTVCRNSTQNLRFYLGNVAPIATGSYAGRIRMSTTSPGVAPPYTGYTLSTTVVLTFTHSLAAFNEGVFDFAFTVPQSLPNGTYFVYIDLNTSTPFIPETFFSDNHTISATRLRLTSSC